MINVGYDIEEDADVYVEEEECYDSSHILPSEAIPLTLDQPNINDIQMDIKLMIEHDPRLETSHGETMQHVLNRYVNQGKMIWKVSPKKAITPDTKEDIEEGMAAKHDLLVDGYMRDIHEPVEDILDVIKLYQPQFKYNEYSNHYDLLTPEMKPFMREKDIEEIPAEFTDTEEIVRIINQQLSNY